MAALSLALAAALSTGPPAATAAPDPAEPVAVAPGVPGGGRAWELVTPADPVSAAPTNIRGIAASGNRVFFMTQGPLPGATTGKPIFQPALAVRGADGWTGRPLEVPLPETMNFTTNGPEALAPDLSEVLWGNALPVAEGEEFMTGFFRGSPEGPFSAMGDGVADASFLDSTADMRSVFVTSSAHLLPGDAGRLQGRSIYELSEAGLRQIDLDASGALASACGVWTSANAISDDGRHVYFTAYTCEERYTRAFAWSAATGAVEIAPQCQLPGCGADAGVTVLGASSGGASAFVVTARRLSADDLDGSEVDLYRYDSASGQLTLLSGELPAAWLVSDGGAQASEDGSRVYFWAEAESSGQTLWLADEGGVRMVAPKALPFFQITGDGGRALFATSAPLLPGDEDESSDAYLFDARDGSLTQVSAGVGSRGNGAFDVTIAPDYYSEGTPSLPYRALTGDGRRAFFTTAEALLPADRNQVADVYEWADGRLGLVSAGTSDRPAVYQGATGDGRTALFRTTLTLVPSDRDGGDPDTYAARIGGGFAEPPPAAGCQGDACRLPGRHVAGLPAPAAAAGRLRLRRPDAAARRLALASGRLELLAETPSRGRLEATAKARLGAHARTVAAAAVSSSGAGPVRIVLPLSTVARRRLQRGEGLRIRIWLRFRSPAQSLRTSFLLEGRR